MKASNKTRSAAWQAANLAAWRAANPERAKASNKVNGAAWRAANPERKKAANAAWRANNPEREKARKAAWRAANPERQRQNVVAWKKSHPKDVAEHSRRGLLKRKRLLTGVQQDDYTRAEIFGRDGWLCKLEHCRCLDGRTIDPDRKHPDPWSASIDHITPLSLGGDDTRDNVRAAHFGCNSSRGNRVPAFQAGGQRKQSDRYEQAQ